MLKKLEWFHVNELLPGDGVKDCLVELENGEHHIVTPSKVREGGIWLAKDGKTRTKIVLWLEITRGYFP